MGEAALKLVPHVNKTTEANCTTNPSVEQEKELMGMAASLEEISGLLTIATDDDYANTAIFARKIKRASAKVTAFFAPMKKAAHKAHMEICRREKVVLEPLTNAETSLKRMMSDYILKKECERRMLENSSQEMAHEEMEHPTANSTNHRTAILPPTPKIQGIRQTKDWEITSIDFEKVSLSISGVELQAPQTKGFHDMIHLAVLQHIRMAKGAVQIPGVVFRETYKTSIEK